MVIMTSCCCWRSVRKGSYACGIYTLVYFTLNAAIMSVSLHEDLLYMRSNNSLPRHSSILEPNTSSTESFVFTLLILSISSLGIVTSLILLLGLYLDKRWMFLPWVATIICLIGVDVSHCVYVFIEHTLKFNPMSSILLTLDFFLMFLNVYALLCVISQYQELRAGRGRGADDIYRIPNIHYSTQPTATSFLRRTTIASPTPSPTAPKTEETHRKSVKFPDDEHPSHNSRSRLDVSPWTMDMVKAPVPKDTAPLIDNVVVGITHSGAG